MAGQQSSQGFSARVLQRLLAMLLLAASLGALALSSCASSESDVQVADVSIPWESHFSDDACACSIKQVLVGPDGQRYPLLPTFDDPEAALGWINGKAPDAIAALRSENLFLGPLDAGSWQRYRELAQSYAGSAEGQSMLLLQFLDIYENEQENAELVAAAQREGFEAVRDSLPHVDVRETAESAS